MTQRLNCIKQKKKKKKNTKYKQQKICTVAKRWENFQPQEGKNVCKRPERMRGIEPDSSGERGYEHCLTASCKMHIHITANLKLITNCCPGLQLHYTLLILLDHITTPYRRAW